MRAVISSRMDRAGDRGLGELCSCMLRNERSSCTRVTVVNVIGGFFALCGIFWEK